MMLERDEQIFLNPSWSCSIPNLFFLIFALLSFSCTIFSFTIFSFMIFSFMISDSTNNGKTAEVLLGSWDLGYQNRVFWLSVWNFVLRFYLLCFFIVTFPYFHIFLYVAQWFVCNIILDFQAKTIWISSWVWWQKAQSNPWFLLISWTSTFTGREMDGEGLPDWLDK